MTIGTHMYSMQALGSKGMLQVENIPKDSVLCSGKEGGASSMLHYSFPQRYRDAYIKELDTFIGIVQDPTLPCPVTKEDVLLSTRVAVACEISLKEGRVVDFDSLDN